MDDKWRTAACPNCRGHGQVWSDWMGADECGECGGSGRLWLRPSGHVFLYPGGPGAGMWPGEYEKAHPEPSDAELLA